MLTELQKEVLIYLIRSLEESGVEFQVSGGLAAMAYGARRPLYDIDLEIYKKDVEKVRNLFKDYITEDWNHLAEGPEDQFDLWMMTLSVRGVPVDINQVEGSRVRPVGGAWVPQPETMHPQLLEFEGIKLPVQDKDELIGYKRILARDTDLEDVDQIT
ncbi:MAG TPA: hypothetical protein VGB97_04865 [Candidatus Paceibacterota bacterium]|jgi:hypothetical protein